MAISNDQLQTWANAPASSKIQHTHEQIRKALGQSVSLSQRSYDPYLQGSYANSTNIKVDSDVDLVVELSSTFAHDTSKLNEVQKALFHSIYPGATYHWIDFRNDVKAALVFYFGPGKIVDGNKSLKLVGDNNLLNADIVPCLEYRKYTSFDLNNKDDFVSGMKFWTVKEGTEIINYPKVHIENGESKNSERRTDSLYKDIVRVMKNIRRRLVEDRNFDPKVAPSYFIECAIYNTPDIHFADSHKDSLELVFDFLNRRCDASKLITVSHQHLLFGTNPWQWNMEDAASFLALAENYYLNN